MQAYQGAIGLVVLLALAWLVSDGKRRFPWRVVAVGLIIQLALALVLLKSPVTREVFLALNEAVQAVQRATEAGTTFVFGYLGGGALPFAAEPHSSTLILAFQFLPIILVVSALAAVFWHWRILPMVIKGLAWLLTRWLGLSGALGLGTVANIFVGMIEAPLFIRPVFSRLTRSELFILMTAGMATIGGTVMLLYAAILSPVIPDAIGHILIASVISVPAAVVIARIMVPETAEPAGTDPLAEVTSESPYHGTMDAITKGTQDGLGLLLNVTAMLIVMIALVALVDSALGLIPSGEAPVTLERIFGALFRPLVWTLGIPWAEAQTAGNLMGVKTVLNELVAYSKLAALHDDTLSERSRFILVYAMCGFANFGSLGIMLGGMSAIAPERRSEIAKLGLRSILSGTLATCMTGALAGLVL